MRELLLKKKKEKRVVKYVLRKYTVGLVSVAISASLISPVAAASVQTSDPGITEVSQEINHTSDKLSDTEVKLVEESIETTKELSEESVQFIEEVDNNLPVFPTEEQAQEIVNKVIKDLTSVQYEDLYNYLKPYVKDSDRRAVINELKNESNTEPTAEEIEARIKKLYMEKLGLKTNFDNVQKELESTLKRLIKNTDRPQAFQISNCKYQIILGLTYLDKQYSFKFNDKSAKDIILYDSDFNGTNNKDIYDLIAIGDLSYSDLELRSSVATYKKRIAYSTGEDDIFDFIEKAIKKYSSDKTPEVWFKEQSKAWIVESKSERGNTSLYKKMKADTRLKAHLIPLLAVSENSIYAISTMSTVNYGLVDTYFEDKGKLNKDEFKTQLEKTAEKQEAFLDFWYRISKVNNKLLEGNNIVIIDSLLKFGKQDDMSKLWSVEYGNDALPGVREFIAPLGFYTSYFRADGQAGTDVVHLFLSKSLTDRGQSTYTHELTHILDDKVWLNGYKRREGKGAESFARGLFEVIDNTDPDLNYKPMFNLNLTYELKQGRVQNASPNRFKKEEDLQKYMQGLMDVVYTLDYAEAQSSLSKTAEEKAVLYNQLELTQDKKNADRVNDTFKNITLDTASKLQTIDDLVDNNIVSGRFAYQGILTTGTVADNGYYMVPLFDPIYAAMQNDKGAVGDITFKRNAYELLAEYGYSKGMVSYISNEYSNDEEALKAILDSRYNGNLATFKKDMFALRISRLSYLKATDYFDNFEQLQQKMDEAVNKDLEAMKINKSNNLSDMNQGVTAVNDLKTEILQWYLEKTKDFEESIYEDISVGEFIDISEEKNPIVTINKTDDSLWEDESYTIEGTAGTVKVTKVWRTENNISVGMPLVKTEIINEGTPTTVYTGTKKIDGEIVTVDDNVEIPIKIVKKEDSNLYLGQTKTVVGKAGVKKVTITQKTKKDQPVGEAVVTEEIIENMTPTVVYIGTKSLPQKDESSSNNNTNIPGNVDNSINNNIDSSANVEDSAIANNIAGINANEVIVNNSKDGQSHEVNETEDINSSNDIAVEIENVQEQVKEETEEESMETKESKDSDSNSELKKNEEVSKVSGEKDKTESKKNSNAVPIAVASGLGVSALIAVGAKSVFGTKVLTILKSLFRFK